ncbi:MAG: TetR/AcrR family transcriptional regulator [Solirubrobacteraceae bacterium]
MIIPLPGTEPVLTLRETQCGWASLEPEAKHERLLTAAFEVFARDGIDAPMSDVANAAGAGVASVYRCFSSKHELLAALVVRRMDQIVEVAKESEAREGDRWSALVEMLRELVEHQSGDTVLGAARMAVADHPDVIASTARATAAMDRLLAAARVEGRLRPDASALDLRLVFAATRAAKQVEPEHWPRMLELLIDALDSRRGQ